MPSTDFAFCGDDRSVLDKPVFGDFGDNFLSSITGCVCLEPGGLDSGVPECEVGRLVVDFISFWRRIPIDLDFLGKDRNALGRAILDETGEYILSSLLEMMSFTLDIVGSDANLSTTSLENLLRDFGC